MPLRFLTKRTWRVAYVRNAAISIITCAALAVGAGGATAEETVVFAGWGGSIQQNQRDILFDSFEKETGIRVIDTTDVSYAKIKAMVDAGDVQWDVVQTLGMWTKPGIAENLFEPLDYTIIDSTGIPRAEVGQYAIGNSQYALGFAYNTDALAGAPAPQSWADFWDAENFPGRRGFRTLSRYMTEYALLADGVPMDEIYPMDVDRAFASLDKLKPHVSVWSKSAEQAVQIIAGGEVAMGFTTHTRAFDAKKEGIPLEFVWQGAVMTVDNLIVPRGAKNKENAMKLINWMSNAENQAKFAEATNIGPSNERALGLVSAEAKEKLPTTHFMNGELLRFGDDWWADNIQAVDERMLTWAQGIN